MKKILVLCCVALVVTVAAALLVYFGVDPTGSARGSRIGGKAQNIALQQELWKELSRYERTYLGAYAEQFAQAPDDPMELLTAFNELAYSVTGPGGLWRKTVPDKYFGCSANEDLPVCAAFRKAEASLGRWDALQEEINNLEDSAQAGKFLQKNRDRLGEYIKTYAPEDESLSAVQATPYYRDNLARAAGSLE